MAWFAAVDIGMGVVKSIESAEEAKQIQAADAAFKTNQAALQETASDMAKVKTAADETWEGGADQSGATPIASNSSVPMAGE